MDISSIIPAKVGGTLRTLNCRLFFTVNFFLMFLALVFALKPLYWIWLQFKLTFITSYNKSIYSDNSVGIKHVISLWNRWGTWNPWWSVSSCDLSFHEHHQTPSLNKGRTTQIQLLQSELMIDNPTLLLAGAICWPFLFFFGRFSTLSSSASDSVLPRKIIKHSYQCRERKKTDNKLKYEFYNDIFWHYLWEWTFAESNICRVQY